METQKVYVYGTKAFRIMVQQIDANECLPTIMFLRRASYFSVKGLLHLQTLFNRAPVTLATKRVWII